MMMFKDENVLKMLEIIDQITKEIPEKHQTNIFWSPKTNSVDGKVAGFRLYAYGGYVLRIFIDNDTVKYQTNIHAYKDNYFEDLWSEEFETRIKANKLCKKSKDIDTLLGITNLWGTILEAYKKRMYGEGRINQKYLERGRATTIARNLELYSETKAFYIFEQESSIKTSKKKPDLIGMRNENNKTIISFIEYKCTEAGMKGVTLTEHFEDMIRFYQNTNMNTSYETLYDQMLDFAEMKSWQSKKDFRTNKIICGEIVFLFSNIENENGSLAQRIYNDICRLIYECKEYPAHKEHVRFLILKDEKELYEPSSCMDAETLLKQEVFMKCNKDGWKEQ